eukprot:7387243-Prymnesium_polylepis.1
MAPAGRLRSSGELEGDDAASCSSFSTQMRTTISQNSSKTSSAELSERDWAARGAGGPLQRGVVCGASGGEGQKCAWASGWSARRRILVEGHLPR